MGFQNVFKRLELKYILTREQKDEILAVMSPYMSIDRYGRTNIRNIYFDTENYRLIRRSIEKPAYKEKLRIRSYGPASDTSTVFVELKKKYESVVYKRRIPLTEREALSWLLGEIPCPTDTQISREIDYFLGFYKDLKPAIFLSYDREAYYAKDGSDFRVTFDENILYREENLTLKGEACGTKILPDGAVLMEVKAVGSMPLWLANTLSREKIYKTSFSKYGTAYRDLNHNRRLK